MKIKKLIKLLECIEGNSEGKLPRDMYKLDTYTKNNGKEIPIAEMDFVHVIRAFQNLIDTEYDKGLEVSVAQTNMITKLESEVSNLREKLTNEERGRIMRIKELKERNHALHELLEKKSWTQVTAPRYVFSEIPNDCDGQRTLDDMKKYFNRSRYKMRVLGQHVKEEYKGTGVTAYGQNIEQSTHLRVYIEEK
tara:strand:- start:163 stop:741 length:579 start_codon:yes stop_codon:yes gene_type:complete